MSDKLLQIKLAGLEIVFFFLFPMFKAKRNLNSNVNVMLK